MPIRRLYPKGIESAESFGTPQVWTSDNFAQDWFVDATNEARNGKDYNARRREIILSTCFAESYLFEWVRRKVQIDELNDYFPPSPRFNDDPRYRRSLKDKWKELPGELYEAGKIRSNPNLDLRAFGTLLKYRHGLIHASASRPATDSQPKKTKPFPTKGMLKRLKPGWAVQIVVALVTSLHKSISDTIPDYIENP